ncbi:unnamed protein product [Parnassius apollo]|uniref:(apollo) hypothetical protein n=1 Tax=Parnassius apollo TaxID=110799 RepID=A0A8S3WMI1_PARAO|nr:unnamed protein product [Parnassius apollo]
MVKKARYVGIQATQFNTYVTLKLQNVKSTTVTVKGPTPCWEQDFLFEINDINLGLLVEVWNKGVIWDRALGYHYLPLTSVAYNEECLGRWIELEAQLMMRGGAVVGTTGPTGHALLLDCRFEPPFDAEGTGGADLQRKLDMLNGAIDAERAEQARRQLQYVAHSGYSEDSDYTSDLNYPVGQHANCSASQFRSAAHQIHTPQRSLEASRENSYEREEYHMHGDTDPLYYNSQPRTNRIESWSQMQAQVSVESAYSWRTAADWQSGEEQRRPSLERQNTLYDDNIGYGYDAYTTSTAYIRDHSHLSHETSYEEYYDSSSYPYGPYETRTWDSNRYLYDDRYGLTTTEYENTVNKRRSSVVQLPQLPPKQLPPSSRYSDYNEMAPYRPRPRRTAASLPATPSSTPKRGRALPLPPGSDHGSTRRGRRLPRPPRLSRLPPAPPASSVTSVTSDVTIHTHVPYKQEPERAVPDISYGYDTYGYQSQYHDTATEQYQDTNYSTSYDEDGMQPFFDETPHATPPAATAQKPTWETETTTQLSYPITSEEDAFIPNTTAAVNYLPQPPVSKTDDSYLNQSYQQFSFQYEDQQQHKYEEQDQSYKEEHNEYLEPKNDFQYQPQYEQPYQDDLSQNQNFHIQYHQQEKQLEKENYHQNEYQDKKYEQTLYEIQAYDHQQYEKHQYEQEQYDQQQYEIKQYEQKQELEEKFRQKQEQNLREEQQKQYEQDQQRYLEQQQQQLQQQQRQQQQQQQQKLPTQQLQSSVLTGAATLGSLMAGGAKKLGSFFGAAAAAVAPSPINQPSNLTQAPQVTVSQITSNVPSTPLTSTTAPVTASVPEVPTPITISTTTTTTTTSTSSPILPRTPSLRRQESIQRPSVRRTRTLPDAPEDYPQSSFDESAYEDDYQKTELDQSTDKDRTSLDRYHDDDYMHDTIHKDVVKESQVPEVSSPSLQNTASPTRVASRIRKPSVDSYHSQAPSIHDRKPSQSSVHIEEKLSIPTTQEELINDKSKVTFQDDRTVYHEVPEEFDTFQESRDSFDEPISEYHDDHQSYHDQDDAYREESEKFDDQEQYNETDEQYNEEDTVFQEEEERHKVEQLDFQPEQPKLTPKQRWHRAYNKIVMQLNKSIWKRTVVECTPLCQNVANVSQM